MNPTEPFAFPAAPCGVHFGTDEDVSRFVPLMEDSRMIDVRIENLPSRRLLALLHHGDYQGVGQAFERVNAMAGTLGVLGPDAVSLGIYYDDPDMTPADRLRSHACVAVPSGFAPPPEGFEILDLAGGEHAVGVHRGPYDRLHDSYRWLFGQWLPSSGREPSDQPCHEIYVNDPRTVPAAELVTHICVPLRPRD